MPSLNWIGKEAVEHHHKVVPYRLLHCDGTLSAGDTDAGNLIVQGDNLEGLKALLPYYGGRVKCIYIDPPYNTGNEKWRYNDNVASPEIVRWLGQTVGKDAEDLSRHDKWLCMMYPRLRLLRSFLREDGVLFASIDHNELSSFHLLLSETFPGFEIIAVPIVNNMKGRNDKGYISTCHEYLMMVARPNFVSHGLPLTQQQLARFKNVDDNGHRFELRDLRRRGGDDDSAKRENLSYPFYIDPKTKRLALEPEEGLQEIIPIKSDGSRGRWRWGKKRAEKYLESLIPSFVKKAGKWNISYRVYLDPSLDGGMIEDDLDSLDDDYDDETGEAVERSTKPKSFWWGPELSTDVAGKSLKAIFGGKKPFEYPKPVGLLKKIIALVGDKDAIFLDSFAGSGTTAQAVLEANKDDGGSRKFILVEMERDIAEEVTSERTRRVISGYRKGNSSIFVEGTGGGFRYCRLGVPLFNEFGDIDGEVTFPDLAAHVFFAETGAPIPSKADQGNSFLGTHGEKAVFLLFAPGQEGVPREALGNVLTPAALAGLPPVTEGFEGTRVVYAEGCTVAADRLRTEGVVFKQIPYQIAGI